MKVQYIILLGLSIVLTSCFAKGLYNPEEYVKMSDDEIKNIILDNTPIGSDKETVRKIVKDKFGIRPKDWLDRNRFGAILAIHGGNIFKGQPYTRISVDWNFNEKNKLTDIEIHRTKPMK